MEGAAQMQDLVLGLARCTTLRRLDTSVLFAPFLRARFPNRRAS